ncbi:CLUMA_CG009046, isoform A [Clunio marinus]|uniref:CLUMA_CG009046, isoform A n=1 Tax=Clunio marinus TaxID=568069 RepID=A0A1J1I761_9DIPT|nr:CLUMA_CG009046, isoform A [Clunio marinus]
MKLIFSVFLVLLASATFVKYSQAANEPDCVGLANENPLKINRYYHPHDSDCNKYYQCSRYGLVEMQCPEGLNFDRNLYICGRPYEFITMKFLIIAVAFLAILVVVSSQQAPDCVSLARQVPEDISKYYFHHENDCNKYYQCAEYGLVLKNCPEDLHFDRNLYICGWPHEVNC